MIQQRSIILPALLCLSVAAASSHPLALRQRLLQTRADDRPHHAKNELNRNLQRTRSSLLDWKRVLSDGGSRPFGSLLGNVNAEAHGLDEGNDGRGESHVHGHDGRDDVDNSQSDDEEEGSSNAPSGESSSSSGDVRARKLERGRSPGMSKGGKKKKKKKKKGKSDKGNASGRSKGNKGKGNKGIGDGPNFSIYFPDQSDDDDGSSVSSGESSSSSSSSGDARVRKLERGRLPDRSNGEKENAYGRVKGKSDKGNAPGREKESKGIGDDDFLIWLPDQRDDDDDDDDYDSASASSGEASPPYSSIGDARARKPERARLPGMRKGRKENSNGRGKADKGNAFGSRKGNKGTGNDNFSYLFPKSGDRDFGRGSRGWGERRV
mmetsp:Transcript_16032/g.34648  ORF Transcript_16032/g.34648 Transcript_16032/m.34648 type:complete len:379 (+) Transcript_16032:138-1274(+)